MGQLRNGEHNVTINEVTVSHRAAKNSPHDACTWDLQGIRGVVLDGGQYFSGDTTVVRSVNVTIGGVSFECDAGMLDVLGDPASRKELVERSLAAQAEKDAREASLHDWQEDEGKRTEHAAAWQCKRCTGWCAGPKELELPAGGCLGRAPTEQEKRQQDAGVAIQELGRRLQAIHEQVRMALQGGAKPADAIAFAAELPSVEDVEACMTGARLLSLAHDRTPSKTEPSS